MKWGDLCTTRLFGNVLFVFICDFHDGFGVFLNHHGSRVILKKEIFRVIE